MLTSLLLLVVRSRLIGKGYGTRAAAERYELEPQISRILANVARETNTNFDFIIGQKIAIHVWFSPTKPQILFNTKKVTAYEALILGASAKELPGIPLYIH